MLTAVPVTAVFLTLALLAGDPDARPVAVVLPLEGDAVAAKDRQALSELLVTRIVKSGRFRAMGKSDIEALLGLEKTRDLLGCSEVSCTTELSGALGASFLITGNLRSLGKKVVLTLQLIDAKQAVAQSRASRTADDRSPELLQRELELCVDELFTPSKPGPAALATAAVSGPVGQAAQAMVISATPKQLVVRAVGRPPAGETDSLARLSRAKREAVQLGRAQLQKALGDAPYGLSPAEAERRAGEARQEFAIEPDQSVVLTLSLELSR